MPAEERSRISSTSAMSPNTSLSHPREGDGKGTRTKSQSQSQSQSQSSINNMTPKQLARFQQRAEITSILNTSPVDVKRLQQLSRVNDGFLSNTLRCRVWPKLLGVNRYQIPDYKRFVKVGACLEHTYE